MIRLQHLFFSIVAFFSVVCVASDATEQLKLFSKTTKNASGEFIQQQVVVQADGQIKVIKELTGNFLFLRPGKFVWETTKPYEQKMLADGKQLMMWDKDLNQVTYRKADQALAATPAAILFGDTNVEQYFTLKNTLQNNDLEWVELIPKTNEAKQNDIPYSKIGIGMANHLPQAMELRDNFGNVVLLRFKNIKTNISITPSDFIFKVPAGTDIVKLP